MTCPRRCCLSLLLVASAPALTVTRPWFFSPSSLAAAVAAALICPQHWCPSMLVVETATALRRCLSLSRQWGRPLLFWQWSRPTRYCPLVSRTALWSCPFCYLCLAAAVAPALTCPCCHCCLLTLLISSAPALTATRSCFLSLLFLAVAVAATRTKILVATVLGGITDNQSTKSGGGRNGGGDNNGKVTTTTKARRMTAVMATAVMAVFLPDRQQSA